MTSMIPRSRKLIVIQSVITASLIGLLFLFILKTTYLPTKYLFANKHDTKEKKTYPYTIITGSSANHLCSLENFLYSLNAYKSDIPEFPRIVVYNIGMNRTQLPILEILKQNELITEVVMFDHERYPSFWDVAIDAGQYGWKTGIVNDARVRYGGILVWLDAGNQVSKEFLLNIPSLVKEFGGFWSPKSAYNMGKWTHPGMFKYFGVNMKPYRHKSNCNGAAIGFDTDNATIVNTMIVPWFECGLVKNCIAPRGSSRANHRQDQAVLTFLAYLNGHECTIPPRDFHLQTHRDQACRSNLMELDLQHQLQHPSSIDSPKWERENSVELYNHPEWKYPQDEIPVNIRKPLLPLQA